MDKVTAADALARGDAALAAGGWAEARAAYEAALAREETAGACFGLAQALWWLGENHACVTRAGRAYTLFRRSGEVARAAHCALWLAITYKANFANFAAANGWIGRAERLLDGLEPNPLRGWLAVSRAYRMLDLERAEALTEGALAVATDTGDADLELVALSQLGLIRVGRGETETGFALIDEAMAGALGGDRSTLDTVVYACCDMLNACELASDLERAAQWCQVADEFVRSYGCPFLYAECRIYYGSVLVARGRWEHAERELRAGLRITDGASPGLHARALTRLAGLRVRQGRLEEAEQLLFQAGDAIDAEAEVSLWLAALRLARGEADAASANLEPRLRWLGRHRAHLAAALDLLVDAHLAGGDTGAAATAVRRMGDLAAAVRTARLRAMATGAEGRLAAAQGDAGVAVARLTEALRTWAALDLPYETARTRVELAAVSAADSPETAVEQARLALAAFEALGAAPDADRTAAFLRALGVVPRTGAKGVGVLTGREQEVLRLLGAGLSNPEIAERLHVSRKTASHHVSSILTKLNLRNRAEAAAYAVSRSGGARRDAE